MWCITCHLTEHLWPEMLGIGTEQESTQRHWMILKHHSPMVPCKQLHISPFRWHNVEVIAFSTLFCPSAKHWQSTHLSRAWVSTMCYCVLLWAFAQLVVLNLTCTAAMQRSNTALKPLNKKAKQWWNRRAPLHGVSQWQRETLPIAEHQLPLIPGLFPQNVPQSYFASHIRQVSAMILSRANKALMCPKRAHNANIALNYPPSVWPLLSHYYYSTFSVHATAAKQKSKQERILLCFRLW